MREDSDNDNGFGPRVMPVTAEVLEMSAAALNAEVAGQAIKETLLASRKQPLLSRSRKFPSSAQPVLVKALQRPSSKPSSPRSPVETTTSQALTPPAPAFGNGAAHAMAPPANPHTGGFFGITPVMSGLHHGSAPSRSSQAPKHIPAAKPSASTEFGAFGAKPASK
jgi:hypothetical protein